MTLEKKIAEKVKGFVAGIEKICYRMIIIPTLLSEAREYAEFADIFWMEEYLKSAQKYAEKCGKDISVKVSEIKKIGYTLAARKYAELGDVFTMEEYLKSARKCAEKCRANISDQIEEIREIGYKTAVLLELEVAKKYAEFRDVVRMELFIRRVKRYAKKCGMDISDQIKKIREIYKKGAEELR